MSSNPQCVKRVSAPNPELGARPPAAESPAGRAAISATPMALRVAEPVSAQLLGHVPDAGHTQMATVLGPNQRVCVETATKTSALTETRPLLPPGADATRPREGMGDAFQRGFRDGAMHVLCIGPAVIQLCTGADLMAGGGGRMARAIWLTMPLTIVPAVIWGAIEGTYAAATAAAGGT